MDIWIVEAEHHEVPGRVTRAFSTHDRAEAVALALSIDIAADMGIRKKKAETWSHLAGRIEARSNGLAYVDIKKVTLDAPDLPKHLKA